MCTVYTLQHPVYFHNQSTTIHTFILCVIVPLPIAFFTNSTTFKSRTVAGHDWHLSNHPTVKAVNTIIQTLPRLYKSWSEGAISTPASAETLRLTTPKAHSQIPLQLGIGRYHFSTLDIFEAIAAYYSELYN